MEVYSCLDEAEYQWKNEKKKSVWPIWIPTHVCGLISVFCLYEMYLFVFVNEMIGKPICMKFNDSMNQCLFLNVLTK